MFISERETNEDKVVQLNRVYSLLSSLNQLIVRERDESRILEGACRIAVNGGGFKVAWIGLLDREETAVAVAAWAANGVEDALQQLGRSARDPVVGPLLLRAVQQGQSFSCNDVERQESAGPWRWAITNLGGRSLASFPITVAGKPKGIVVFCSAQTNMFQEDEMRLLEGLAADVSFALDSLEAERRRARAEEALRHSEQRLQILFDSAPDAIFLLDLEGVFVDGNLEAERLSGYRREEMRGKNLFEIGLLAEEDLPAVQETLGRARSGQPFERLEVTLQAKDGDTVALEVRGYPVQIEGKTLLLSIGRDVTERRKSTGLIAQSLREKELLLKEIHHRVRNNMQVIISLLNLQASESNNPETQKAIRESQNRVRSMALIHEKLYGSADFSSVDMAKYIDELGVTLFHSYKMDAGRVRIDIRAEQITLGIDEAIPCGLILNELMSNALKYAFPDGRRGEVKVSLGREMAGGHLLEVRDNGIGLPAGSGRPIARSLGLQLVDTLTRQLGGTWELAGGPQGAVASVRFGRR